jgi:hypothetical protein
MPQSHALAIAAVVLAAIALTTWVVIAHRRQQKELKQLLERLGFRPCPAEQAALEAIVVQVVNDKDHRYQVDEPHRLGTGEPAVYYYVKVRDRVGPDDERDAGQELLFRLKRRSRAAALLFLKPSSIKPGIATRMLAAAASGPWSTQPDDLTRLELPADLKDTNLLAALGPAGASLYDLVDAKLLAVVQGLGDAGAAAVRLRDDWCAVEAGSAQVPFRVDEIVTRVRSLL